MFDICTCKCENQSKCSCEKHRKVPQIEHTFLIDQRSHRKLRIGGIDAKESTKITKRIARNGQIELRHQPIAATSKQSQPRKRNHPQNETVDCHRNRNIKRLKKTAQIADRFKIPHGAAAVLASAVLEDHGILNESDSHQTIDRFKIARERKRLRMEQIRQHKEQRTNLKALYFDSRIDSTKHIVGGITRIEKEDHYSLVEQPGSLFLDFFAIRNEKNNIPKAKTVAGEIQKFFQENDVSTENLIAIGCDGTVLNTGYRGGVIQYMEEYLKRPVQWIICFIHCNELPLRHLFIEADGRMVGPNGFSGPLGKKITTCEKMKIETFAKVPFNVDMTQIAEISHTLSSDQKYMFDICCAISNGGCSDSLSKRSPGKLNHARWLTLANRILRLYVSTTKPTANLKMILKYIMTAYAPCFFHAKHNSSVLYGSVHLAELIKSSQFLPTKYQKVVNETIQRNAFFAHPENVLLAMINDDDMNVRRYAWTKIWEARQNDQLDNVGIVRSFKIPKINFQCNNYTTMIDLENNQLSSPPVLDEIEVTSQNLDELAANKVNLLDIKINDLPCHTQSVERCVKIVTEASMNASNDNDRLGLILNTLKSRNLMSRVYTKKDYQLGTGTNSRFKI